jgi:1-acyl-sn-glycerol-3-phosphate acyltransferase
MYIFKSKSKQLRDIWCKAQIKLLGINLIIEGKIDNDANMIAMNHQSLLDIIILEHLHSKNLAWVAKIEIAKIPWFGHILKAPDMIMVQRESKSSLMKLIRDTKDKYDQNRPIAIFPEGTRTNGLKLRKFKAGAKLVAQKHNFRVQPIVIVGSRNILDTHNFTQQSGTVKVIFLPSVQANKNTTWYLDMEQNMSNILKENIGNI